MNLNNRANGRGAFSNRAQTTARTIDFLLRPAIAQAARPPKIRLEVAPREWQLAAHRLGAPAVIVFANWLPPERGSSSSSPTVGWPVLFAGKPIVAIVDRQGDRELLLTLCHELFHLRRGEVITHDGSPHGKFVRAAHLKGVRLNEAAAEAWAVARLSEAEARARLDATGWAPGGVGPSFWDKVLAELRA